MTTGVTVSVPASRRRSALALRRSASAGFFAMREAAVRGVQVLPGPVGLDGRAIEVPGLEFVEAGFDQNRYLPTVQGDVDRLPGAQKACADSQVHGHVGELRAEGTRLYSPPGSQRDWARRVAAEHVRGVRCGLGVTGEDEQAEYLSRRRWSPSPSTRRIERPSPARSGMHAPRIVRGGIIQPRTVSGGASDAESRRCAVHRTIGQAPHVVQDAEVLFHLQGRPFEVPVA